MALFGALAWDRVRVDTPVTAELQGEGDCAVSAVFTDPSGTQREVGLRPWRGSCARGVPGEETTVWYDASDPSVTAPNDRWWWPLLVALAPLVVVLWVGWSSRGRPRSGRPSSPNDPAPAAPEPSAPETVGIIYRGGDDAHLVHDYAVGRIEALRDRMLATRADVEVATMMDETRARLVAGDIAAADRHYRQVLRRIESWRDEIGDDLRGYGRNIFGPAQP